jgi:ABC-type antimicrobial peptide transport system permease subunit
MAEVIMQIEHLIIGAVIIAIGSVLLYLIVSKLLSSLFVKHWLVFLDNEGKVKEIIPKSIRKGKNSIKHRKNEYQIDPTHRYHIMAYDEKNELRIKKDGTLDSLIRAKTVEEYELAAFSLLSKLLQSKIRAVDFIMLLLLGIVAALVFYGIMHGGK